MQTLAYSNNLDIVFRFYIHPSADVSNSDNFLNTCTQLSTCKDIKVLAIFHILPVLDVLTLS